MGYNAVGGIDDSLLFFFLLLVIIFCMPGGFGACDRYDDRRC